MEERAALTVESKNRLDLEPLLAVGSAIAWGALALSLWGLIERSRAKVGGSQDYATVVLRGTVIFRKEEGVWRIAHRHADPITAPRAGNSIIQG